MFCSVALSAAAQPSNAWYDDPEGRTSIPQTDWDIVPGPSALGSALFADITRYESSFVRYRRRGSFAEGLFVNSSDCVSRLSPYMHYPLLGALRPLGSALRGESPASAGPCESLSLSASAVPRGHAFTLYGSDGRYNVGARVVSSGILGRGWSYAMRVDGRVGRDRHTAGVFARSLAAAVTVGHTGRKCGIDITAVAAPGACGLHSAAVAETFDLTGDRRYNPSWGYQGGRVRNARVSRSFTPMLLASFDFPAGRSHFRASVAGIAGERSLSGLAWYGAMNPLPDYWRLLPSYLGSSTAEYVEGLWREREPSVVHIDWDELLRVNAMAGGEAVYIVERRVERPVMLSAAFSGDSRVSRNLRVSYGADLRFERNRLFKLADDLLGARWFADVDRYLVDDEYLGDSFLNDTDRPDRRVREGERFGYDCRFSLSETGLRLAAEYDSRPFGVYVSGRVAALSVSRRGYYRKESLPDDSFGASDKVRLTPYVFRVRAEVRPDMRHAVSLSVAAAGEAPSCDDLFLSPCYSNALSAVPELDRRLSAEVSYLFSGRALRAEICGFFVQDDNAVRTVRYYDDLSSLFSDMVLTDLRIRRCGVEAAAEIPLSSFLTLEGAMSVGSYAYASDPHVRIVADADHGEIVSGERSLLAGYRLALPQCLCTLRLNWSARGWRAALSGTCLGGRHSEVSPVRRMHRVADLASSPESFEAFIDQERLPAAWNVRLYLSKVFSLGRSSVLVSASVDNLLDSDNIYSAYEQNRVMKSGTGMERSYSPFPSKYRYGRPRTFYLSLTYRL